MDERTSYSFVGKEIFEEVGSPCLFLFLYYLLLCIIISLLFNCGLLGVFLFFFLNV